MYQDVMYVNDIYYIGYFLCVSVCGCANKKSGSMSMALDKVYFSVLKF